MNLDLSGSVALVTGSASGIGASIAQRLAESGAHVVANDIDPAVEATVSAIRAAGGSAEAAIADVSDESDVAAMSAELAARHGRLTTLVNNAGVAHFAGIEDTTPDQFDRLMGVDLRGPYLLIKQCLPLLTAAAPSSVTCIASVHARATVPFMTGYAAAKTGLVGMVRSLAQELGPKDIRVNTVSPGFVRTPLYESWLTTEPDPEAADRRIRNMLPLRRIADVRDVADVVAFLSSAMARCITGADYLVDSGLTTRLMH